MSSYLLQAWHEDYNNLTEERGKLFRKIWDEIGYSLRFQDVRAEISKVLGLKNTNSMVLEDLDLDYGSLDLGVSYGESKEYSDAEYSDTRTMYLEDFLDVLSNLELNIEDEDE